MVKIISPSGMKEPLNGFKGWKFLEWLKGNVFFWEWFYSVKKLLKEFVKVTIAAVSGMLIGQYPAYEALIGVAIKMLLDSVEYWFKEKKA